jgi:hypothetical protein
MLIGPHNTREAKGALLAADRDRLFDDQHHGGLPMIVCSPRLAWSIGRSG